MLKYFTNLQIFTVLLFSLIYLNCSQKPKVSKVDNAKYEAEKANKELIEETGEYTKVEKDFSEIEYEITGTLNQPASELTRLDFANYKTGDPGWITLQKQKRFSDDMTRLQAKENLLRELRNEAINKKVGTTVEVTQLLTDVMSATINESFEQSSWSGFFKSTVSGIITNERQEKNEIMYFNEGEGFELDLMYSFYVEPVKGQRDPGFWLESELESNMLKEGENLIIRLRSSKDAFVYIFNLMADNNAVLMYPNDYMEKNFLMAETELVVPDPKIQNYISFIVGTMPDQKITSESVYIVCTKQKVPVIEQLPRIGQSMQVFSSNSQTFIDFQRWLASIPLNQRVEKALLYHVSK